MIKKTLKRLKLLRNLLLKNPKKLSNGKLEALLGARVHAIEKHGNIENSTDFYSMIWARKLYHEARKREILSNEEIRWHENVLFGKQIEHKPTSSTKSFNETVLLDILKDRRSIRFWEKYELTEKEFELLVNAAKWAPSSSHRQPWHFLLTRDKEKIKILAELRDQKFVGKAPNCILVLINLQAYTGVEIDYTPYLDAAAAIQNLLLMAHVNGLGACWVNFGKKEIPDVKKMNKIKSLFEIPDHIQIISIIPIGRLPSTKPHPPGRRNTSDIMHIEKY